VVGAGPAGLACACTLAERGHDVTLFDQASRIGGQFNFAKRIPGKEEFHETLRYFEHRLDDAGVTLRLGQRAAREDLAGRGFDEIVLATGITPRAVSFPGSDDPRVLSYLDVLARDHPVGPRVAVIGAGGIGFDVAEFLVERAPSPTTDVARWSREWGVDRQMAHRGGLQPAEPESPAREVWLLQRSEGRPGARLNKTTGWVHRANLKAKRVQMLGGVSYERLDETGLHIKVNGESRVLPVDHVVVCAGQEPNRALLTELEACGLPAHVIGGADVAAELDAKRAIAQGTALAASL
jgi:2,4-dienoyl-CoA reductase (NADPH2)